MREKLATVRLRGGLGNQLFQYSAGLAKARALEAKLVIDARQLPVNAEMVNGVSHWPEQISAFRHGADTILRSPRVNIQRSRLRQIERATGDAAPRLLARWGIYANELNPSLETFAAIRNTQVSINAYCNSPSYFQGLEAEIRDRISDLVQPSDDFLGDFAAVQKNSPLAIHIRLGDYKNLKSIYGGVDVRYFVNSVALARQLSGDREVWLFSDEPQLASNILDGNIANLRIAPTSNRLTSLESLLIISKCEGIVASNSTFSWWAAFLMKQSAPIIFPRPFYASQTMNEPKSMLLENWIQLGRQI